MQRNLDWQSGQDVQPDLRGQLRARGRCPIYVSTEPATPRIVGVNPAVDVEELMECAHGQTLVSLQPLKAKRYKPSRFNARSTTEDGTLLVYNSYSGHNSAFPPPASSTVESYLAKHGITGPLDRLAEYLVGKGFLVEEGVDESACWDVRYGLRQFRTDVLQLILLASEDCNFRCIYCSQEFKRGTMLPRVREGTRNLIRSRIRMLKSLNISWFGGEPLLGYEAIEELAPFCQEIAKAYDVYYHSHITTNGYLLTPDRSRKMVEWGIVLYQITVDGSPVDHDAHRPLKDGGGTFERILVRS